MVCLFAIFLTVHKLYLEQNYDISSLQKSHDKYTKISNSFGNSNNLKLVKLFQLLLIASTLRNILLNPYKSIYPSSNSVLKILHYTFLGYIIPPLFSLHKSTPNVMSGCPNCQKPRVNILKNISYTNNKLEMLSGSLLDSMASNRNLQH